MGDLQNAFIMLLSNPRFTAVVSPMRKHWYNSFLIVLFYFCCCCCLYCELYCVANEWVNECSSQGIISSHPLSGWTWKKWQKKPVQHWSSGMKTLDLSFECPRICCSLQRLPPYRMHLCILAEWVLCPISSHSRGKIRQLAHHSSWQSFIGFWVTGWEETRQFH